MAKLVLLLSLCFIICLQATSQKVGDECSDDDVVMKIRGKWTRVEDAIVFADKTFPKNQYKLVYARIDSMMSAFRIGMSDLSGLEARWYRGMRGGSVIPNGPLPYTLSTLYLNYYCNDNIDKIVLGDETSQWANVYVNHYNHFGHHLEDWDIRNDGKKIALFVLPLKDGTWKGKPLYKWKINHIYSYAVVINKEGKLPWYSITQREFLTGLKNELVTERDKKMRGIEETEEALRNQKVPSNLTGELTEKVKKNMDENLKRFMEKKEDQKAWTLNNYNDRIRYIDEYFERTPKDTLDKPAIVPQINPKNFRGSFTDEAHGGTKIIAYSSKYFNKDLGRHVPQFMILCWTWSEGHSSGLFKKQFEENFPLEKLKSLIDK